MSKNIKQNLLNTLDNLNKEQTGGGKKYSKKEVDEKIKQSFNYILALYHQCEYDKQALRYQIDKLFNNNTQGINQIGSGKKYTQEEVDSMVNHSLQHIFNLYTNSYNEKVALVKQLDELKNYKKLLQKK